MQGARRHCEFELKSPPDHRAMFESMARLGKVNPAAMRQAFKQTEQVMKEANPTTRGEMIRIHMDKVQDIQKEGKLGAQLMQNMSYIGTTHSDNIKPTGSSAAFDSGRVELCPIAISSLTLQTTHTGRVLRGKLIVPPYTMTGISSILEDEAGDLVRVAVYNLYPSSVPQAERQAVGEALLPQGTVLCIRDPFYKIAADGGPLVRVDNPNEVKKVASVGPTKAEEWKKEGNLFFRSMLFTDAWSCYTKALRMHCNQTTILSLLLNLSNVYFQLEDFNKSLRFAVVAQALSASAILGKGRDSSAEQTKCWYRVGMALASAAQGLKADRQRHVEMFRAAVAGYKVQALRLGMDRKSLQQVVERFAPACGEVSADTDGTLHHLVQALCLVQLAPATGDEVQQLQVPVEAGTHQATAAELKEAGNAFFRERKLDEALSAYRQALSCELREGQASKAALVSLLSNRANCCRRQEDHLDAYIDGTAAVILDPTFVKAHFHLCSAMVESGWLEEAQDACTRGISLCCKADDDISKVEVLVDLKERITVLLRMDDSGRPDADSQPPLHSSQSLEQDSTFKPLDEREMRQLQHEKCATLDQVGVMNQLASLMPSDKVALFLDSRIPEFHPEFSSHGLWPTHGDVAAYSRILRLSFEQSRALPIMEMFRFGGLPKDLAHFWQAQEQADDFDVLKRLGSNQKEVVKWWRKAGPGSIRPREPGEYSTSVQHSFSNAPHLPLKLRLGTCHVTVGFVDLGSLLFNDLVDDETGEQWDGRASGAALEWMGLEQSSYCVAKTLVVTELLTADLNAETTVNAVMQVWFSSTWSHATLAAFRAAVSRVLQSSESESVPAGSRDLRTRAWNAAAARESSVRRLLRHWMQHEVSLKTARSKWVAWHEGLNASECYMLDDRLALTRYELCGELPGLSQGAVGSTVMFSQPAGSGEMVLEESIFKFIPMEPLRAYRSGALSCPRHSIQGLPGLRLAHHRRRAPASDWVAAAVALLSDGVEHLREAMQAGRLRVGVRLGRVGRGSDEMLEELKGLGARSMLWSNVCDYWQGGETMEVLRRCSTAGTEHTLYTMNWTAQVMGACSIDYKKVEDRREALLQGRTLLSEQWRTGGACYPSLPDASLLLLNPTPTNPYNIADYYIINANRHSVCSRFLQYVASPSNGHFIAADEQVAPPESSDSDQPEAIGPAIRLEGPYVLSNPHRNGAGGRMALLDLGLSGEGEARRGGSNVKPGLGWAAFSYSPFHHNHNLLALSFIARLAPA